MKLGFKVLAILSLIVIISSAVNTGNNLEQEEIAKSYGKMYVRMAEEKEKTFGQKIVTQLFLWSGIGLCFTLYFSVMALIEMPITKNSILYAKYGISRTGNLLQ